MCSKKWFYISRHLVVKRIPDLEPTGNLSQACILVNMDDRYTENIDIGLHEYPTYGRDLLDVLILDVDPTIFRWDRDSKEIKQTCWPIIVTCIYWNYHCYFILTLIATQTDGLTWVGCFTIYLIKGIWRKSKKLVEKRTWERRFGIGNFPSKPLLPLMLPKMYIYNR